MSIVIVAPGDTLWGISAAHDVALSSVEAANPQIANPDLIYAGQKVTIPGGESRAAPVPAPSPSPASVASVTTGIPAWAACIVSRESGGNPRAVNASSDAGGLFQDLPSTWAGLGEAGAYPGGAQTAPAAVQIAANDRLEAQSGLSPWAADGCPGT